MYKLDYNHCNCHPETCCCDPYVILDDNGGVYTTVFNKKIGQEIVDMKNSVDKHLTNKETYVIIPT